MPNILSLSVVVSTIENKVFRLSSLSVENERDLERETSIPHIHNALNELIQNAATLSGENINPHKLCRIVLMFLNFLILFLAPLSCVNVLHFPQVLDGAGLDVDFFISSPSGQVLFSDYRKSDGVHS